MRSGLEKSEAYIEQTFLGDFSNNTTDTHTHSLPHTPTRILSHTHSIHSLTHTQSNTHTHPLTHTHAPFAETIERFKPPSTRKQSGETFPANRKMTVDPEQEKVQLFHVD